MESIRRPRAQRPRPPLEIRDGLNPSRARVPDSAHGMTAFDFVWHLKSTQRYRHPEDTRENLLKEFQSGNIRLGLWPRDRELSASSTLKAGEDIWFYRMPAEEKEIPYEINIIDEDENLLVVDKPPFLSTMPRGRHISQSATVKLRRRCGNPDLAPAHRLDRHTSGVLIFTKKKEMRFPYQNLFATRAATKIYEATAEYTEIPPGAQWAHHLEKTPGIVQGRILDGEPNSFTTVSSVTPCDKARMAELKKIHGATLAPQAIYELRPQTGKTHQLRLQMLAAGIPILGDPAYPTVLPEDEEDFSVPMHLTARELRFIDPLTSRERRFRSPRVW
ncbi:pseudouridine synthase [Corynebacterium sp. ES2794-CONJ1]|uniref:pseudouridine synthase n=1 Tax=unclassified Corynebacterium TaxID=2624378 RepID=UPI0021692BAB|nr:MULTISPECIES: pseudouridine synthase [unclassified Corynebacterium]MCS4490069.1 pseudouridine synthase [Corynebacterium sp. ES2775-CONJ]MCS4532230.1 pseudouridine synthase [Corynebacterium sp. ES2730-CONJ]MCU9519626.1 pseudouridine synthase [Corynebacterium sp. ES2794-CONJ1]